MAKNSAFGKAFASARKAGKKTFNFGGKSYTTKTKEEGSKPPVPVKRSVKDKVTLPSNERAKASVASNKLKGSVPKKKEDAPKKGHGIAMGKYRLK